MEHALNVTVASNFSVSIALFLQHIKHWTLVNLANKKNIHDGLAWTFDTLEALGDIFPYWTKSQRETVIKNAIEAGLVVKGNYNKNSYDRTVWYALTPKAYAYYPELLREKYLKTLYLSISEKSEMDFSEFGNGFPKFKKTIPDTKTDTKPDIKTTTTAKPKISSSFDSKALNLKPEIDTRSDQVFLENVYHHIKNNSDQNLHIRQREAGMLSILTTLFNANEIFCSNGFIDKETKKQKEVESKRREEEFINAQNKQWNEVKMREYKKAQKKCTR